MYTGNLDLDRGMTAKGSFLNKEVGMIFMYKDAPGKYFKADGYEVSETIARLAGFDVEQHAKERFLLEQKEAFNAEMMEQLRLAANKAPVVLVERGSFKVVEKPHGRADVTDTDGVLINAMPLTIEEAMLLLDKIAPVETTNV